MSKVYIVGQRPLKEEDSFPATHIKFFVNKEHPEHKKPFWYSGLPDDMVEESVQDTKRWMETEGFNDFCLELVYD
jgi:hypothetical protein